MKKGIIVATLACLAYVGYANAANLLGAWPFSAPSVSVKGGLNATAIAGDIVYDISDGKFYGSNGSSSWTEFGSSIPNLSVSTVTSTHTVTTSEDVLLLSGASFNLTLYTAVGNSGKVIEISHEGTSLSQVYTLLTTSGQTIGSIASGSYALYTNGEKLKLISDGSNWKILNHVAKTSPATYTPATTQGFGTVTASTFTWWRDGATCFVQASWTNGTVAASEARIGIPDNITHAISLATPGQLVGMMGNNEAIAPSYPMLISGNAYFTFGHGSTATGLGPKNGSSLWGTGIRESLFASFPVSGWQP
jgi:hypothetical protein